MKKLYEKSELAFAIVCIVLYCVLQSLANPLSEMVGLEYSVHAVLNLLLTAVLLLFLRKNGLGASYGLCKGTLPFRALLWYLPLVLLSTNNLWNGVTMNLSLPATLCYLVSMLCVGVLEELIFRGLLFRAMAKDNLTSAVIVSSVSFGLGHILNLVNGSGMDLVSNLFQIVGAVAIGFLYVLLYLRGGSLIPCILSHSAINMLSAFANESGLTLGKQILFNGLMISIAVRYSRYLVRLKEWPPSET